MEGGNGRFSTMSLSTLRLIGNNQRITVNAPPLPESPPSGSGWRPYPHNPGEPRNETESNQPPHQSRIPRHRQSARWESEIRRGYSPVRW